MAGLRLLEDADGWRIHGVRDAAAFLRAIHRLVPHATHLFLEGSPTADIVALLTPHIVQGYAAPIGTIWSWPQRNRRFALRASAPLFERLAEAAQHHAEPEICSHLHVYRHDEPLVNWFDAFDEPVMVSKVIPHERIRRFCVETGGILPEFAG